MNTQITFPELVTLIAEATNTTELVSELFIKELFATISQALIEGKNVTVKGIGTFKLSAVARSGGDGYNRLVFEPDAKLAEAVNEPFALFETVTLSDELTDEQLQVDDETCESHESEEKPDNTTFGPPPFKPAEIEDEQKPSEVPAPPEDEAKPADEPKPVEEPMSPVVVAELASATPATSNETITSHQIARRWGLWGFVAGIACTMLVVGLCWLLWPNNGNIDKDAATAVNKPDKELGEKIQMRPVALVYDTITPTNYLSRVAKKHYGRSEFWIYIYTYNKKKIDDPNNVPPGTVVVIPALEDLGINPKDPSSIEKAKQLTYETFAKTKTQE